MHRSFLFKKIFIERYLYWKSDILPKENYCYLENNNLKLNFSFVENLAPVCPYNKEIISNKKKILIIGHDWDFIDNIIDKLDRTKYKIEKYKQLFSTVTHKDLLTSYEWWLDRSPYFIPPLNLDNAKNYKHIQDYIYNLFDYNNYDIIYCEWFELFVPVLSTIKNKNFN